LQYGQDTVGRRSATSASRPCVLSDVRDEPRRRSCWVELLTDEDELMADEHMGKHHAAQG